MVNKIKQFAGEVSAEMKKVSWPTSEQLNESTKIVIVISLLLAFIVAVMDFGVEKVLSLILG